MSRNKSNIKMQLHKRIDELLRIGQKKVKETRGTPHFNPNRSEGIHSIKTAETYRQVINIFAEYCKTQGIKDVAQIDSNIIGSFVGTRSNLSPWTLSKDLAAINKVLDPHYTPKDFGIQERSHNQIINNRRVHTDNSTAGAERNQTALWFARATGCRRSSILTVTAEKAIRNEDGTVIGFQFREKGGRERNAIVLPSERQAMTNYVNARITESGENCRLVDSCDRNCNPHYCRAEYANELYRELKEYRDRDEDIYCGHRSMFIDERHLQKALSHPRYQRETVHGYETKLCAEISQALGHNRIEVVVNSYLR
jgi:hypothetical protein